MICLLVNCLSCSLWPKRLELGCQKKPTSSIEINTNNQSTEPLLQGNSSKVTEEHQALVKLLAELKGIEKTLSLLFNNRNEEEKQGYWTCVAKKVNKTFFIFYVTVVVLFLIVVFVKWNNAQH